MFGTGENFASKVVPFEELAMLYVKNNSANLKEPEKYVEKYIQAFHAMQNAFFNEKDQHHSNE